MIVGASFIVGGGGGGSAVVVVVAFFPLLELRPVLKQVIFCSCGKLFLHILFCIDAVSSVMEMSAL